MGTREEAFGELVEQRGGAAPRPLACGSGRYRPRPRSETGDGTYWGKKTDLGPCGLTRENRPGPLAKLGGEQTGFSRVCASPSFPPK
jgi:hypothetical protein